MTRIPSDFIKGVPASKISTKGATFFATSKAFSKDSKSNATCNIGTCFSLLLAFIFFEMKFPTIISVKKY
ncbi:MAG: hypothetical protein ACFFB8_16405 [Promethearchaeota archaeon]